MPAPPSSPLHRSALLRRLGLDRIAPTVFSLGWVSLLTDFSSEMIYPLLPLFLKSVLGAGAVALGLIEGVAETTASLLKLVSGVWADRASRRKPFILAGYSMSGLARPLIGLAGVWPVVLLLRFLDRVGKGLRTSPRDALIADVTPADARGIAFGFHRAMDHAGAVAGPLAAALLLDAFGFSLRSIFLLAAVPALAVVGIIVWGVRERPVERADSGERPPLKLSLRPFDPAFRRLLAALLIFTLGNSSDAFLLLHAADVGLHADRIALLWAAFHVVKMLANYVGGRLADRYSRRGLLIIGWVYYAAVYFAFAAFGGPVGVIVVFLAYGVYFGLSEPCERALVADLAPTSLRATAYGLYHATVGLAALPASILFGAIWHWASPAAAFGTGAAVALVAAVLLGSVREKAKGE